MTTTSGLDGMDCAQAGNAAVASRPERNDRRESEPIFSDMCQITSKFVKIVPLV
jgi:hypothetical protein